MGYQDLKKVVKMINDREVDIVLFTGDLIDANYKLDSKEQERVINLLKKIDAKLGKYAISGEEDGENFNVIFNQSDFSILNNNYELIYNSDNNPILLVGIDSYLNKNYDYNKSYAYFDEATHNSNIYTISMMHEADMVDDIKDTYHSDLYLGGHSHNGNIRIPYIGSLVNEEGSKIYNQAFYNIEGNPLYISSGLGTTGNGIRLFCRPSINFFRISNK